jgi:hypothetical protein
MSLCGDHDWHSKCYFNRSCCKLTEAGVSDCKLLSAIVDWCLLLLLPQLVSVDNVKLG